MSHEHHHSHQPSVANRAQALESLLIEKGFVDGAEIDSLLDRIERDLGPLTGARVVARAWVDPDFKRRLLADAPAAIADMGIDHGDTRLIVVENTPAVHNVVCCTLCSCYPWKLLGLPPTWYKSTAYRSRVVIDPRGVLAEFGLKIEEDIEVRVWDSSSDCRYMVLPERPAETEGANEDELIALIGRDALVGVARVGSGRT